MFTKVHHVTYVVHSIRQMEDYLERNFGMVPERTDDFPDRGYSSIMYRVGTTLVDFFEPTGEDTAIGRWLKEGGPGVAHVAWEVGGIDQVFQDLKGKGNELRGMAPQPAPSAIGPSA